MTGRYIIIIITVVVIVIIICSIGITPRRCGRAWGLLLATRPVDSVGSRLII